MYVCMYVFDKFGFGESVRNMVVSTIVSKYPEGIKQFSIKLAALY